MTNKKKSLFYTLGAVLFWSTVATAFKFTLQGMTNAQLLFYSSLTSTIVLYYFAGKGDGAGLNGFFLLENVKKNALLGFINPFSYYLILFKAYSILPAQEAQPINLTWPLLISIGSVLFLKEKLSVKTVAGLLVSFTGILIIATRGNPFSFHFHNLFGVAFALASTFLWTAYWIFNLIDKRSDTDKLFGAFFYGTIYTGIYLFLFDSFFSFDTVYLLGAFYIGLFEMGITFVLWLRALSLSENKAQTSTIVYLFPVISLFFIALVLKEPLRLSSVTGLAFIITGILVQHLKKK